MGGFFIIVYIVVVAVLIARYIKKKENEQRETLSVRRNLNSNDSDKEQVSHLDKSHELPYEELLNQSPDEGHLNNEGYCEVDNLQNIDVSTNRFGESIHTILDDLRHDLITKEASNKSSKNVESIIDVSKEIEVIDYKPTYNKYQYKQEQYDYSWGLGTEYKKKLELSNIEVKYLNALIDTTNKFNSIEYCKVELIKMFCKIVKELDLFFVDNGTLYDDEVKAVAEIEIPKRYRYRKGSKNYQYELKNFDNTIKQLIYKTCENRLREHFNIGRKTDLGFYISSLEAMSYFEEKFMPCIDSVIKKYLDNELLSIDHASERELNMYSRARWKAILKSYLESELIEKPSEFYEHVVLLGELNKDNPSVENIFFDASKAIAKIDKVIALKLYVYYVYYDMKSVYFDNKQLTKTVQRSLFVDEEQKADFEKIVNDFIVHKKLDVALEAIDGFYKAKKKRIKLNASKIAEVKDRHSNTVNVLNEYLQDDDEVVLEIDVPEDIHKEDVSVNDNVSLSKKELEFIMLFPKSGFVLSTNDAELFAKNNGLFKSALLDNINEACYELLDDVLLEEDDEQIYLNEEYYNIITT